MHRKSSTPDGLVSFSWQRAPGTATNPRLSRAHSQRSTGGVHFLESIFKLMDEGTSAAMSAPELAGRAPLRARLRACLFPSLPQSTMLRLVLALCVAAASGTLRLRVVSPARAAETCLPPLWRRTMGQAAGGGCGDCAQRGCSIELRLKGGRRAAARGNAGLAWRECSSGVAAWAAPAARAARAPRITHPAACVRPA